MSIRIKFLFCFLLSAIVFVQCTKEPIKLGTDLLSNKDVPGVITLNDVSAYTFSSDSLYAYNYPTILLGNYVDSVFGFASAEILTQLSLSQNIDQFEKTVTQVDSVVLLLECTNVYGKNTEPLDIMISPLTSNIEFLETSNNIYTYQKNAQFADTSVLLNKGGVASSVMPTKDGVIRIALDPSFAQNYLLNATNNIYLNNDSLFQSHFKGINIRTKNKGTSNTAIINLDLSDTISKIVLYYNGNKTFIYSFGSKSRYVTLFNHDYDIDASIASSAIFKDKINSVAHQDSFVYLQGMAGVRPMIDVKNLTGRFKDSIINYAELVIPFVNDANYSMPTQLAVQKFNKNRLPDDPIFTSPSIFKGTIDGDVYKINITRFVQGLASGTENDARLFIIPGYYLNKNDLRYNPQDAGRAVIKSNLFGNEGIRINITYTKIN